MNSKIIIALIAIIIASVSGQYYYPSAYSGYYPGYAGYAGYASGYPSYLGYTGYAGYYPSAFSSLYYGYGSNKGAKDDNTNNQAPQIKLTNNQ
ncbi:Protein of unknown function DUF1459 family-containing protein [Strongyloides ratti]|uniref:Uncharacterized protein n=1 Tax=Strongyloides ratti TaxID=34506 RepID=A0A090LC05_STRRB|nr:Protein of unknown function DUF1459 family-containing protein [Strongyloides ratti]CEF65070.1 Protein of unknown function DUF1459 family-containing protein [Strongyloides ratti]